MNKLIVFLFVITICFVSSEACARSRVEIVNEIGRGVVLEIECKTVEPTQNLGRESIPYNDLTAYTFVAKWERRYRTIHTCDLWYALPKDAKNPKGGMNAIYKVETFAAGSTRKCGQFRQWVARSDGLYFRRSMKEPLKREPNEWNTLRFPS